MLIRYYHEWTVTTARARQIQDELKNRVCCEGEPVSVRYVAGVDVSVNRLRKTGTAAIAVLAYPEMSVVEVSRVTDGIRFPYVPGLLTFREAPLALKACEMLEINPDLFLVDGQGYAHPRRIGLASHLGLCLDTPTIGCAKSRLIGEFEEPGQTAGSESALVDSKETIGKVGRTRAGVRPLFISVGHNIGLEAAVRWTLACCRGYRLPEPTRLAHQAAGGHLKI